MNKSLLALCLGLSFLINGIVFIRFISNRYKLIPVQPRLEKPINLTLTKPDHHDRPSDFQHSKGKKSSKAQEFRKLRKNVSHERTPKHSPNKLQSHTKSTNRFSASSFSSQFMPVKHESFVSVQNSRSENLERNKHFSFYKRILEDYINKLNANLIYRSPAITKELAGEELVGRIIFDVEGNAQALKILKWSRNDKFQEFFLHSLKEIRNIPNPPSELISTNEDFTVTYGLKVIL